MIDRDGKGMGLVEGEGVFEVRILSSILSMPKTKLIITAPTSFGFYQKCSPSNALLQNVLESAGMT